ncbi:response regulator [Fodinisporobacter ferrooxydans]|uniref:Response regulator n=1 Tax=Fodinisporobacter ferrooxydans TaxID=2901836 RepID=A0ABY4CLK3_9BACL|nr:response regulator [Alicyclobacillaceae bacterium MYW30-H2]
MKLKILIADDDRTIRYTLREICSFAGWDACTCSNGREALEYFKQEPMDVVLVDYHMPEMDGLATVRELRKLDTNVPILVLTVDERQEIADRFLDAGATDFALKPVKAPDLISRIQLHIRLIQLTQDVRESNQKSSESVFVTKGINQSTLVLIQDFLQSHAESFSIDDLSEKLGLAYPTVHRYITYLLQNGKIQTVVSYQKIGRPKNRYQWIGL